MLVGLIIAILFGAGLTCLAGAVFAIATRLHNAHCILLGMLASVAIEIVIFCVGVRMPPFEPGVFVIALGLLIVAIMASIFVGPLVMTRAIAHRETGV